MAARQRKLCSSLAIWSHSPAEREEVRRGGLADLVTDDPTVAAADADLVILCTPPGVMLSLATRLQRELPADTVVSDVASVKGRLARELHVLFRPAPMGSRYVGAHPMAGAELGGFASARADLFEGRPCLLTPMEEATAPDALERVSRFWQALGMHVRRMSPEAHDEAVALVSHLPHLLAAALAGYVGAQPGDPLACAGPGWRDMTRLAGGNPDLWTEILSRNRLPVTNALRGTLEKMRGLLATLESGREADLHRFLTEAKERREEPLP